MKVNGTSTFMNSLLLTEFGAPLLRSSADLSRAAGLGLEELQKALHPLVTLSPSWTAGEVVLRPGSWVGTVQFGDVRIDVRPRVAAPEMVTLVRYAFGGPVRSWHRSAIAEERVGLEELVCSVFADELTTLRQLGLSRNYVDRKASLPYLRGRPDFIASFPWNDGGMTSIACRYHELTSDNLDNQLLRSAIERATLMDTTVQTRRRIAEHRHAWSEFASPRAAGREDFVRARGRYTRLSEHYPLAHNLAELIVLGRSPGSAFHVGPVPTGGLKLNMADLFERFVARTLRDCFGGNGFRVCSQESDHAALLDRGGSKYSDIRPDTVVYRNGVPIAVVDAKYKQYWGAHAAGAPLTKVSNEDLYQLFFYSQRLQLRHDLERPPAAWIISPLPAGDERGGVDVVGPKYTRISWQAGSDVAGSVDLRLMPLTQVLRRMAGGSLPRAEELMPDGLLELLSAN